VFELFKKIELCKFKNFIDLGSGDGRVVLIASLFTSAAGIEYDAELHRKAVEIREKLKIKANLIRGDFMHHDLSKYDIIFINPDKPFNKGLERKLQSELKGILLVYNMVFSPDSMKKGRTYWLEQTPATVYTIYTKE
jgi:tRNA1(Val) A37 N6-methylase TrmN6